MCDLWGDPEDYRNLERTRKNRIYLICPVRNISDEYRKMIETHVEQLEQCGNEVYYPARDTKQNARSRKICEQNALAIRRADQVYIIWDGNSQGCLFDLGIAYAEYKPVKILNIPDKTKHKSFQNFIYSYATGKKYP